MCLNPLSSCITEVLLAKQIKTRKTKVTTVLIIFSSNKYWTGHLALHSHGSLNTLSPELNKATVSDVNLLDLDLDLEELGGVGEKLLG